MKKALLLILSLAGAAMARGAGDITLYGQLYTGNGGYGVYSFSTSADKTGFEKNASVAAEPNCGSVRVGDRFYVFSAEAGDYGPEYCFYVYDAADSYTLVTRVGSAWSIARPQQVLACDPTDKNKIYSIYQETDYYGTESYLGGLDVSNRSMTKIGSSLYLGYNAAIVAMAFNPEGQLYAIASTGVLYKVDKATAELTYVGSTGLSPKYEQSMTFSPDGKTIWWAACSDDVNALYSVDPATGRATKVKDFAGGEEFVSLWAGEAEPDAAAPAAPTDVTAAFAGVSLSGTVSFDVPAITYAGTALSGQVSYEISTDGNVLATGTAAAGAHVDAPVTVPAAGSYTIKVSLSNAAGIGGWAVAPAMWIGPDVPTGVLNARLEAGDAADTYIVSWEAPERGVHGGQLDPTTLRYRVRRLPSFEVISDNAVSPLTDTYAPAEPELLSYEITAYEDENTRGIGMTTNSMMVGTPYDTPWTEEFASNDHALKWTVVDANDDGHTWEYMYDFKYFRIYDNELAKDDWLISPYVQLVGGVEYRFTMDVRTIATEDFEVRLGRGLTPADMTEVLLEKESLPDTDYSWVPRQHTFTCAETGNYHIGIHAMSDNPADALALYVDNIKLEKTDPAAVTDVETEAAAAEEYYNLQGMRVTTPTAGQIYIVRRAGIVSKILK